MIFVPRDEVERWREAPVGSAEEASAEDALFIILGHGGLHWFGTKVRLSSRIGLALTFSQYVEGTLGPSAVTTPSIRIEYLGVEPLRSSTTALDAEAARSLSSPLT